MPLKLLGEELPTYFKWNKVGGKQFIVAVRPLFFWILIFVAKLI